MPSTHRLLVLVLTTACDSGRVDINRYDEHPALTVRDGNEGALEGLADELTVRAP